MLPITLDNHRNGGLRVLIIGAHCDDIEIGCGGTIMRLSEEYKPEQVRWVVFTSTNEREVEAKKSSEYFLRKFDKKEVIILNHKDGYLPYAGKEVKDYFEELKSYRPDLIFTHCRDDLHQDHRFLCELTWNTFRDHLIFEYEIPKYDDDLGHPNFFVPLDSELVENKVNALMEYYPSQSNKHWFDKETFLSVMRIRGFQSASKTRYAEAFYLRKSVF